MAVTCIITGYKIGVGTIIIYGFLISGTVFYPPSDTTNHSAAVTEMSTKPDTTTPVTTESTETIYPPDCGIAPKTTKKDTSVARMLMSIITERIIGGAPVDEGAWPWMAYLFDKLQGREKGFLCGGALINNKWIVTAAHCVEQPNSPEIYGIVLGEHSIKKDSGNELVLDVGVIVRHSEFDRGSTYNNDIALMKFTTPIQFTRHYYPVCLLPSGFPTDATTGTEFRGKVFTYAGRFCTVLGWGKTAFKRRTDIMQQLNVIIMPNLLCKSATKNPTSKPYGFRPVEANQTKFCAGGTIGQDTCDGDSGGPLLCVNDDGKYYLHGVTSYGTTPCGQKGLPGVYTRLTDFYDWIMNEAK